MEIEQNSDRFRTNTSRRRYMRKILGKSAGLFSLACHVGASEAKAPKAQTETLRRAGYNIGMAFQIIDDILDYTGDPKLVRKPLGNDITEGLVTLPLICALAPQGLTKQANAGQAPEGQGSAEDSAVKLRAIFQGDVFSPDNTAAIVELVRASGGIEKAQAQAELHTLRALKEIGTLPRGNSRDKLETLTRRLLTRES
jgi:heptaprenyl diphosphate synthase